MIYEYALEPDLVAHWGEPNNFRFFMRAFGLGQGRVASRFPKSWVKKVWNAFDDDSEMKRMRLDEMLVQLKETMVKRKECCWNQELGSWLENVLLEHDRHPYQAILARNNPENLRQILCEDDLVTLPCKSWDTPHGITVNRKAAEMAAAIEMMLSRCRWIKFIDPYFSQCKNGHKQSLIEFLRIFKAKRPVGSPETIEIHTSGNGAATDFLKDFYEKIIPVGLTVTLFQWQERFGGQKLHNRYILTDLGGVSFHHGLDTGKEGETDDLNRLGRDQYELRCKQYDPAASAFDQATPPLAITGILGG